jgi:hypothetical protein
MNTQMLELGNEKLLRLHQSLVQRRVLQQIARTEHGPAHRAQGGDDWLQSLAQNMPFRM